MQRLGHITVGIYEKALPQSMTWPERLAIAARAGFDFVEMSIDESDARLGRLDWRPEERAALRAAIADTGVPITSICLSGHRRFPLGSPLAETRQQSLEIMHKTIWLARDIGARMVLVPGYHVYYERGDGDSEARFVEGLRQGIAWARQAGVLLALENTERSVTSVTETARYVRELDSPWLRLYVDVGNLVAAGHDVLTEVQAGAGYVAGVHVKDARPGVFRDVPFGEGSVPFTAVFRALWALNFSGPIMLEMWVDDRVDALEVIMRARQWVQARLDKSWEEWQARRAVEAGEEAQP